MRSSPVSHLIFFWDFLRSSHTNRFLNFSSTKTMIFRLHFLVSSSIILRINSRNPNILLAWMDRWNFSWDSCNALWKLDVIWWDHISIMYSPWHFPYPSGICRLTHFHGYGLNARVLARNNLFVFVQLPLQIARKIPLIWECFHRSTTILH